MPGPNVIAIAVCVGAWVRGLIGAIAAASGFGLIPLTIGFLLGVLYLEHTHLAVLQRVLGGVSSVAAGMLIATGIRMLLPHRRRSQAWIVAGGAIIGLALAKLPLLVVLLGTTLVSIVLAEFGAAKTFGPPCVIYFVAHRYGTSCWPYGSAPSASGWFR